jgi:hypothetical protein
MVQMPDKEFKSLILKVINDFKLDSDKERNEVRKSIQDLNEKLSKH